MSVSKAQTILLGQRMLRSCPDTVCTSGDAKATPHPDWCSLYGARRCLLILTRNRCCGPNDETCSYRAEVSHTRGSAYFNVESRLKFEWLAQIACLGMLRVQSPLRSPPESSSSCQFSRSFPEKSTQLVSVTSRRTAAWLTLLVDLFCRCMVISLS